MKAKIFATLFALLLVSSTGCGQQDAGEGTDAPAVEQAPAPAPEPAQTPAQPQPEEQPTQSAPPQDDIAAGEEVSQQSAGSEASRANTQLAQAVAPPQSTPASRWKPGVNYTVITPAQPTSAPADKVEVMEIFWYGCPHCYGLEPYLQSWSEKKAPYVHFVRVPVVWGPVHKLHAQLYYTLLALDREDLHIAAFRESQVGNRLIGRDAADTERVQLEFAKRNGVEAAAFSNAYRSKEVATNLQRAEELTRRYRVQDVPRMIINGKYVSNVNLAGGQSQLMALINDMAALEHKKQ